MGESEWVDSLVARALAERGFVEVLERESHRGDWHCAEELCAELCRRGECDAAVAVCRPFADRGLWDAVNRIAKIWEQQGPDGIARAVALVRPVAEAGERLAVRRCAELLSRQGRMDEVFAMLRPALAHWYLAAGLVEATVGAGRDDEVVALLRPFADAGEPSYKGYLATVLERQDRVDEAVGVLRSGISHYGSYNVNHVEQIADILARHDPAGLAQFVTGDGREYAAERLAGLLDEQGRQAEAVEVLRPFEHRRPMTLADLLIRLGRAQEAIEVLRRAAAADYDCYGRRLGLVLIQHGRPDEALALADAAIDEGFGDPFDLRMNRIEVLVDLGRIDAAIADLRADPEADETWARHRLGELLAYQGHHEQAIAVLESIDESWVRGTLAEVLVRHGQPEQAVALFR